MQLKQVLKSGNIRTTFEDCSSYSKSITFPLQILGTAGNCYQKKKKKKKQTIEILIGITLNP